MVSIRIIALAALTALATAGLATAQTGGVNGLFSRAEADLGGAAFETYCATCHSPVEAAGFVFSQGAGEPLTGYLDYLSEVMPPAGPKPSDQEYLHIFAYLAAQSGAALRADDVTFDSTRLASVIIPAASDLAAGAAAGSLEWTAWRGDNMGAGFSPATQINAANAAELEIAWRWSSANIGPEPETRNITTPLMANGVLYATAGVTRNVVALDAATGQLLWLWRPNESEARFSAAPRKGSGRGVALWENGAEARIFTVTPGFHLAALDAATGRPVETFGNDGVIDLMEGLRGLPEDGPADIGSSSPPLIIGDVVVVGPAHRAGVRPRSRENVKGDVRAYDARTGRLIWTFNTIPARGEPGYGSWAGGSAEYTGNAGVWAPMSADHETGAIFLPVEAPTSDFYGGERLGMNEGSSSLVSLDARTGEVRWRQQLVHHDIWDWDVPAIPILADIPTVDGPRRAVVQITKQSFVYAFDRDTGEPIWPLIETPVPASDTPGEWAWATQPMPSAPAPFDRQGLTHDDLIDFTPELRAEALEAVAPYRLGQLFSPASPADAADGTRGTISTPGMYGGGNWEGGAYDPTTGLLFVGSQTAPSLLNLGEAPGDMDIGWRWAGGRVPSVQGLPLVKPPYGRITAIDLTSGAHAWMIANADTPEAIAEHTALQGLEIPRTGVASRAGLLVTPTLLFAGEGIEGSPVLRAHNKQTGEIVAEIALPGTQTGLPMSYVEDGRQYIVMAVGVEGGPAEIIAMVLPD